MDHRIADEISITDLFDQFIEASTMRNVLSIHHRILNYADLEPCEFNIFFPKLKRAVMTNRVRKNWKAKALFSKIDKKAAHRCYSNTKAIASTKLNINDNNENCQETTTIDNNNTSNLNRVQNNNALKHYNCLIIGSGPAGLRTAIELQLLGSSRVVVVEKRSRFSRNNVLHLWPFVIDDLKSLGAKKFYGKFCAGSIDHISIRQLQLILLKICLMIGCDFRDSCSYLNLCPSSIKQSLNNTKQALNTSENNSDKKNADGISDSIESITLKCDYNNVLEENFIKVSNQLKEGTENNDMVFNEEENKENGFSTTDSMKTHEGSLQVSQGNNTKPTREETSEILDESINKNSFTMEHKDLLSTSELNSLMIDKQQPKLRRGDHLRGVKAHFQTEFPMLEQELHSIEWDVIIGADGRRNTLTKFFPRKEFRGRLAIAITANFINRQTPAEASVSEISGLSFIYNQDMFNALAYDTNIQLENICYYKDDTHYFVMTAKKKSLLERGVLKNDYATTQDLLSEENINKEALLKYAKDAAYWTTGLEPLDFALNHYGQEDCAMFDFTSMYAASNACKALRTKNGGLTLLSLVGDSLLEPFWPTGSGCARGFLSSFDAAWMCRQWAVNKCAVLDYHTLNNSKSVRNNNNRIVDINLNKSLEPTTYDGMALSVMAERESIYRILAQTTSENLQQNYSHWTLNPHSRYPNLNRHLILPSQVEHLITDNENQKNTNFTKEKSKYTNSSNGRRVKSPFSANHRKSPKKLKSGYISPSMQVKQNNKTSAKIKSMPKQAYKYNKSKQDSVLNDIYLEFQESYNDLSSQDHHKSYSGNHYLSSSGKSRPNCEIYDDYFVPSISGTLPSSNNLMSLEARRARDIDECLRQRRQKTQISIVRDQLVDQFKRNSSNEDKSSNTGEGSSSTCRRTLFNELRKLREQQQSKIGENNQKVSASGGPLTLLNSMRRCASFAERVKSFESKLGQNEQTSTTTPSTPKVPIDNVKNLPEFATLQEILVNNTNNKDSIKKVKMPIMKLSKDDWNVKCWEKRLAAYKQKNSIKEMGGSTKSLNKAYSVDSNYLQQHSTKPEKQVEVFRGRIKEMADKLKQVKDSKQQDKANKSLLDKFNSQIERQNGAKSYERSKSFVNHLKRELIRGVEARRPQQAMNPVIPSKPIKKLFDDDEDEEDGKHYDHLCINRPTNKYLSKNKYSGHLVRTKYDSSTSKVINRTTTIESKQAYLNALASRGSSASSTLSDYSTATGGSSSGGSGAVASIRKKQQTSLCFRCDELINLPEKITIDSVDLHRNCLACASCGLSLRTNELQYYLKTMDECDNSNVQKKNRDFICIVCNPKMTNNLNKKTTRDGVSFEEDNVEIENVEESSYQRHLCSREQFLSQKINYNELYKTILDDNIADSKIAVGRIDSLIRSPPENVESMNSRNISTTEDNEVFSEPMDNDKELLDVTRDGRMSTISPTPVSVTLPLNLVKSDSREELPNTNNVDSKQSYTIARSESIDGSEQVTLVLPVECETTSHADRNKSPPRAMIDEDEFYRILHLDANKASPSEEIKAVHEDSSEPEEDTSDENKDYDEKQDDCKISESSSLDSPQNSDSTYEDFSTSEEFGLPSEDENGISSDNDEKETQTEIKDANEKKQTVEFD